MNKIPPNNNDQANTSPTLRKRVREVTGIGAYEKRLACKLHFESVKYDYFKYRNKIKSAKSGFAKMSVRQQLQFKRLETNYSGKELDLFLASSYIMTCDRMPMVHELLEPRYDAFYIDNIKWLQAAEYNFRSDINKLVDGETDRKNAFNRLLTTNAGNLPQIYKLYIQQQVNINTIVILDHIFSFSTRQTIIDPLAESLIGMIINYGGFIEYDKQKCCDILRENIKET